MRRVAIIPARYGSTRFPGKALASLHGKELVVHVLDRVREAGVFDEVLVATDDERIVRAVEAAGGRARMTAASHTTGTERVAELAAHLPEDAIVFNVQGDEPLMPPRLLRDLMACFAADPSLEMLTAAHPVDDAAGFHSPHVVKVVLDGSSRALYFSRAPIPYSASDAGFLRHVGIYGFRRRTLSRFVALSPSPAERREGLEQLRALENGIAIHVHVTSHASVGVDTPDDLKAVAARFAEFLESDASRIETRSR